MSSEATDRLFGAIVRSDPEAVREALAEGAAVNANGPSGGETPLMQLRLCRDPLPILRMLLDAGADPFRTDFAGRTALHHLALCSDPAGVEAALARGVDPQIRDTFGDRALEFALSIGTPAVIDRLVAAMQPLDVDDRTRLFQRHVQRGETSEAVRLLEAGIHLRGLTPRAFPPLHLAARYGNVRVIAALLDAGAELEARHGTDETALIAAAREVRADAVAELLARGADPNAADNGGTTALHALAGSRPSSRAALVETAVHLLRAGADAGMRDHRGYWPRAVARAKGNDALVSVLEPLPFEPPIDPSAAGIATVELATFGRERLHWRPNDVIVPFALEEHIQRDEWHARWLDVEGLVSQGGTLLRGPELAWFAPLVDLMRRGATVSLDDVRAAHGQTRRERLTVQSFPPVGA